MPGTHPCSVCDAVFTKAYELKKHKAAHDDPSSVFHCPRCDFITLQKKNLAIHFKNHIGEKDLECPDMVSPEQRCDYRTHDPAALTKHRKRVHGYTPPSRNRHKKVLAAPIKTGRRMNNKVPRRRRRAQPNAPSPRRRRTRSPRKVKNPNSSVSNSTILAPFLPLENMNEDTMAYEFDFGYDSGNGTLIGTDDEVGLDALFDPSLRSQWMAQFEISYSAFDMTGMRNQLETIPKDTPFDAASLEMRTNREACLCPEWMVEVGIEGWNQPVLETHEECYVIDA